MNKKILYGILGAAAIALTGCADTDELYDDNQFLTENFIDNVYCKWDDGLSRAYTNSETLLENDVTSGTRYFNGSGNFDSPGACYGLAQGKQWYPDYFKFNKDGVIRDLYWSKSYTGEGDGGPNGRDSMASGIGQAADNSSLYGIVYSQTKKLSLISDKFKPGILSKLYNGQIKCNAWSYLSMILLDQRGYGTFFPCQMVKGDYFAFSARGGSDYGGGRVSKFDLNVSFYKVSGSTYSKDSFVLKDVFLQSNQSAELTSLVGFKFSELGYDPKGMVGMSITPTLAEDGGYDTSIDFTDGKESHTGLCLLEVLFPDSTWN